MSPATEVRHTPGPWRTDPELGNESVLGSDGVLVADCAIFERSMKRTRAENRANAQLIAAAPDLLAAAKEVLGYLESIGEGPGPDMPVTDALSRAIAKADGGGR